MPYPQSWLLARSPGPWPKVTGLVLSLPTWKQPRLLKKKCGAKEENPSYHKDKRDLRFRTPAASSCVADVTGNVSTPQSHLVVSTTVHGVSRQEMPEERVCVLSWWSLHRLEQETPRAALRCARDALGGGTERRGPLLARAAHRPMATSEGNAGGCLSWATQKVRLAALQLVGPSVRGLRNLTALLFTGQKAIVSEGAGRAAGSPACGRRGRGSQLQGTAGPAPPPHAADEPSTRARTEKPGSKRQSACVPLVALAVLDISGKRI